MDSKQVQEILMDAMKKVKAKFDEACAAADPAPRKVCAYSDQLTRLAHGMMEVQQGEDAVNIFEKLKETLKEIQPT